LKVTTIADASKTRALSWTTHRTFSDIVSRQIPRADQIKYFQAAIDLLSQAWDDTKHPLDPELSFHHDRCALLLGLVIAMFNDYNLLIGQRYSRLSLYSSRQFIKLLLEVARYVYG